MLGEVGLQAFKKPGPVAGAPSDEMRLAGGKAWGLSAPPPWPDRCQPHTNQGLCPMSAAPTLPHKREGDREIGPTPKVTQGES